MKQISFFCDNNSPHHTNPPFRGVYPIEVTVTPGDHPDWTLWLERIAPAALLYARQITASLPDAQDALHEGFIRFWARRHSARNAPALFFTCVRSAALDLRRSTRRRQKRDLSAARDAPPPTKNTTSRTSLSTSGNDVIPAD
jgi:DNA-directed RNA polymerase specialized sigma24 family protein